MIVLPLALALPVRVSSSTSESVSASPVPARVLPVPCVGPRAGPATRTQAVAVSPVTLRRQHRNVDGELEELRAAVRVPVLPAGVVSRESPTGNSKLNSE